MSESHSSEQMLAETDGASVLKKRLTKDVRLKGTCSSEAVAAVTTKNKKLRLNENV